MPKQAFEAIYLYSDPKVARFPVKIAAVAIGGNRVVLFFL